MESGWRTSFNAGDSGVTTAAGGGGGDGQNGNFTPNNAWDVWDNGTTTTATGTRYDWSNHDPAAASARAPEASVVHALLFGSNSIHRRMPDPHMMCLKLGKRHYCENGVVPSGSSSSSSTKRGKPPYPYSYSSDINSTTTVNTGGFPVPPGGRTSSSPVVVPRCQVEGCHVPLSNAKEYYRKHKVCEIHSKAPNVVVLGLQQRFCQQCSRFHGIMEFDETKRSCRRRLEGHNLRRRKGALSNSLPRNFPHSLENNPMTEQRLQPLPSPCSKAGRALSLLSSPKVEPWISSDDLSSRCSAALCELIAANRAISVVGHFSNQNNFHQQVIENTVHTIPDTQMWDRFDNADHTTMTLDLMQGPGLDFGLLSMKEKSKDPEEWTDYCWSAFGGTNVV